MDYNKQRHKQLLKRSQDLKTEGKNLFIENPEEDSELSQYNIIVEEHIFLTHRNEFLLLMKNFIDNIIDFEEFETAFTRLYNKIIKEHNTFKIDLKRIEKFQPGPMFYWFAGFMVSIFRQFEEVEDEYSTEQEVKDYVKEVNINNN